MPEPVLPEDEIVMPSGPPPRRIKISAPAPVSKPKPGRIPSAHVETFAAPVRYEPEPTDGGNGHAFAEEDEAALHKAPDLLGQAAPHEIPAVAADASTDTPHTEGQTVLAAEPQMRDFQKEATVFVPSSVRRKRAT